MRPVHLPPPDQILSGSGLWAYGIIALVLLAEAVPVLGAVIPAQLFMLGAGFLAGIRELYFPVLVLVGFASLFVADIVSFTLGRRYGMHVFDRLPHAFARRVRALSAQLAEHAGKTLVLGKFLGPARALAPPLAGAARVSWPRFLAFDAAGCFLWVIVLSGVGLFFGRNYAKIEKSLGRVSLVLVLLLIVVYLAVMRFRAIRQDERLEEAGKP